MTLYEKTGTGRGTRYRPVREEVDLDSLPEGFHLVEVRPGRKSIMYRIVPDTAALVAASRTALDAMVDAIQEAAKFIPERTPITPKQADAWHAFTRAMGGGMSVLKGASPREIAEAGVRALIDAAKEKT